MLAMRNHVRRYGLEWMLKSLSRVGEVAVRTSVEESLSAVAEGDYDIVIVALSELGEREGELGEREGELGDRLVLPQNSKMLLVVDCRNHDDVVKAADSPAEGFLDVEDLCVGALDDTLRRIGAGEFLVPTKLMRGLLAEIRDNNSGVEPAPPTPLTPREQDVLRLLVEGLSNKQIARRLTISAHGVKRLVSSILAKLNCPNRTLAAARALRDGLCEQRVDSTMPG